MIQEGAENIVNSFAIDPLNRFINGLPWPLSLFPRIDQACWPTKYDPTRCAGGAMTQSEVNALLRCEDVTQGLENMCAYARVAQICGDDTMLKDYNSLFTAGYQTVDQVEADFASALGDSFAVLDPVSCSARPSSVAAH